MKKRLFSIIMCMIFVVAMLPSMAFAVDGENLPNNGNLNGNDYQEDGIYEIIPSGGEDNTAASGSDSEANIPQPSTGDNNPTGSDDNTANPSEDNDGTATPPIDSNDIDESAKTGDSGNLMVWIILMAMAIVGGTATVSYRRNNVTK